MKKVSISEEDRLVCPLVIDCGYIGENKFEKLEFVIPKEYKKYNKKLNFRLKDGTYVTRLFDKGTDNIFTITSDLAIYDVLSCCVVFFSIENDDEIIGKSSIFKIKFDKTIPDEDISDYEPKVVILDGLISSVKELEKTVTENEKRREEYIDDLKQRVDTGEFNGKDALINGVNTLNIVAGENINLEQEGSTLKISGTYKYDDTNVQAAIAENTENISSNTNAIAKNTTAINENKSAIEKNTTAIQDNKTNIDTNTQDINNLKQKSDDNKNSIDEINKNLKNYSLITETGNKIDVTINSSTYVMTLDLKDKNDNVLSTGSVDLPIESMIINVTYDSEKKELKFTLQNGNVIEVPLNDLISGLVTDESLENTLKNYALIKDVPTKVSQLKNDSNYVKNTDYATSTVAGVVKTNAGLDVDENGRVVANTYNYDEYESKTDNTFISKGTFENAIKGKNLETANNKVTSVGTGSTDIEYPSAKCVYKIKEDVDNLKSDILETGEVSDSYIHVEDSIKNELLKLEVDGVCEQETTTGKNLWIGAKHQAIAPQTINGITYSRNSDGTWNISGTATKYTTLDITEKVSDTLIQNGKSYVKKDISETGLGIVFQQWKSNWGFIGDVLQNGVANIKDEAYYLQYSIAIKKDKILNISNMKIELEEGTTEPTTYEPYTGGQASPSPDYPQEIKTIENSLKITSCNKNLTPMNIDSMTKGGITITNNNDGSLTLNGTATSPFELVLATNFKLYAGTYTHSINKIFKGLYISLDNIGKTMLNGAQGKTKATFELSEGKTYNKYFIWIDKDTVFNNDTFYIQLEQNSIQTPYEQHLETQITANLPEGEFIGKINDTYKDRLKIEYNEEDGQYHLVLNKMISKFVLDGSESWTAHNNLTPNYSYFATKKYDRIIGFNTFIEYSTHFSQPISKITPVYITDKPVISGTNLNEDFKIRILIPSSVANNIETFKTWLSTHNTEVYYVLANPYTIDLGVVDMPLSYDEITNIFTDSDLLPTINAKYYKNFISTIQNLQVNKGTLKEELVDIENRLTDLEENVSKLIDDAPIYGIQRNIADNSDTAWERTDDAVGLVANATHDGTEVRNDFDNIYPWSHMKTVNYDPTEEMITATIGDSNFKFDGSNGQVMTIIPEFYLKHWDDGIKEHWQFSRYALEGFTKVPGFMLGRYVSGRTADNKLMSVSGLFPDVFRTITSFRTDSRAVGKDFGQMDWRYFVVQLLYLVEYADYNSQAKLGNGLVSLRVSDNDKALVAETNANRIIIGTANANYFKVGQAISIGVSGAWNWEVARNRIITSITDYSEGDITGKAINFDGSPVNIAIGNVVWSTGQKSGECDSLGMKSGCLANDSKSAVIYRGLENIFGNVWQFVDGINIKDYVAYVCYNPANYVVDKFDGDYNEIGYTNASTNGYVKTLGHDENHPLIMFPTEVGGSTNTYLSDYYNQNSGNRIALVGGSWGRGASAGLWYWGCDNASSNASFSIGSRLLKSTI